MLALSALGGSASAEDLAKYIGDLTDHPQDVVKVEVSNVLRRGIANGFFQRRGKKYFLFNEGSVCEVDSSVRKRKTDQSPQMETDGGGKKIRLSSHNDESDVQSIDDLQQIIAKAIEDTQKATVLAAAAGKRAQLASMKIQEIAGCECNAEDE